MKKNPAIIALLISSAVALSVATTSCRTSEANYRAAYEQAIAGRADGDTSGIDNTVYDKIRREAISSYTVYEGDTIPIKRERVAIDKQTDSPATVSPAYVIVAQFKQQFNARSLANRLKDSGYSNATVLVTREPLYYVAIDDGDRTDMILQCRLIAKQPPVVIKSPYPLVLEAITKR